MISNINTFFKIVFNCTSVSHFGFKILSWTKLSIGLQLSVALCKYAA